MLSIDVLIVTHKGGSLLEKCLKSVQEQTLAPHQTVVVVSSNAPLSPPKEIQVVRTRTPSDFAPAANLGLRRLGDRPVVLLNDDTELSPTFLEQLACSYKGPGIYQPRILCPDGTIDNTGHWIFVDGFNIARDRGTTAKRPAEPCGAFSGAAVMFSPEVLSQVGVFDDDFGAYGEDLDLSLRAIRRGFTIHHVPQATVTHQLGATYGRSSARKVFLVERNRIQAAVRSLPWVAVLSLPATSIFRLSLMGAAAIQGSGLGASAGWRGALAAIAGLASGAFESPRALKKRYQDRKEWTVGNRGMWDHMKNQAPSMSSLVGVNITPPSKPPTTAL